MCCLCLGTAATGPLLACMHVLANERTIHSVGRALFEGSAKCSSSRRRRSSSSSSSGGGGGGDSGSRSRQVALHRVPGRRAPAPLTTWMSGQSCSSSIL